MEPVQASTTAVETSHSLNIEYFFRIIYGLLPHAAGSDYSLWLANAWSFVTAVAYGATVIFLAILVYSTMRLNQLKEEEEPRFETIEEHEAESETEHARWKHIAALIESPSESDWRQAIIEADIMLEDVLGMHGYEGSSVAEKLKQGDPHHFMSLQDAWEAHKVRNDIAHQGSAFALTGNIAYRTIAKYRNVFEEFHAI